MEPLIVVLLGLILTVASPVQNDCTCATNKWTVCAQDAYGNCNCTLVGSNHQVNCSTLTSKCLLLKAEMIPLKHKRFRGHLHGKLLDDDGIYNPACEDSGLFKARQCSQTGTCWCVNTAGVRRTEKGDKSLSCSELVRTSWIYIELKHKRRSTDFNVPDIVKTLKHLLESRYKLHPKYITAIKYDSPRNQIRLKQKDSEKSSYDVDIADVAYYFGKDIKGDSIFNSNSSLTVSVNGDALDIETLQINYVDEKPPEFYLRRLVGDATRVVTVTIAVVGSGIIILIILVCQRAKKYKKCETEEMGEIRVPGLDLP
ncbi:tumor-associated calcium signal transducer 2 [Pterocles gutturalis]